ncbi:MAG: VOC family protein [Gammaproteobacteria bacterium AqS3]|nr:VOC family protein [Gammaproteobacteria bacterium AqS3]
MTESKSPRAGGILSADIAFPDQEGAARFYSRVLTSGENPLWGADLMNSRGAPVIGVGAQSEEYAHLPLQWMPHIQVADVARSVAQALALGGQELMHFKSDDGASQWAVIADPNGAAFGLIPVIPVEMAPSADGAGCISWCDLTVADAPATCDFYKSVVGWSVEEVEMQDDGRGYADYCMLDEGGNAAAGVCHARGVNADLPPVWLIYLPVGDLAESLRRVVQEGGAVIHSTRGGGEGYQYAVIRDPAGAHLALAPASS